MLLLNKQGLNCEEQGNECISAYTWFSGFAKTFCTNSSISTFNFISSFLACWLLLINSAVFIVMSRRPLLASMSAVLSNLALFSGTWNCKEGDQHLSLRTAALVQHCSDSPIDCSHHTSVSSPPGNSPAAQSLRDCRNFPFFWKNRDWRCGGVRIDHPIKSPNCKWSRSKQRLQLQVDCAAVTSLSSLASL